MSKIENNKSMERNWNIDLIKIIACICVMGLHTFYVPDRIVLYTLYHLCAFAIPFFFMASGYLLLNRKNVDYRYASRKVLSVLRFVLLWNVLRYAADTVMSIVLGKEIGSVLWINLTNCIISVILGCFFQKGDFYIFWYMGATIILYAVLPLLYKIKEASNNNSVLRIRSRMFRIWIIVLVESVFLQMFSMISGYSVQSNVPQALRIWCSLQYFLLGGFMPVINEWIKNRIIFKMHAILMIISVAIAVEFRIIYGVKMIDNTYAEYFYDDPIFIVSVIMLFSFVARLKLNDLMRKVISVLAPLTLGVYASHLIIQSLLTKVLPRYGSWFDILWFAVYVTVCFGIIKVVKMIPLSKYWFEL